MANQNRPSGLSPVQYLNGSPWNGQARTYSIAYNYATSLAVGDPVTLSGSSDVNGVPGIVLATAGANPIIGSIVGIGRYESLGANPNNLNSIIYPANGDGNTSPWYALVADDPNILFEVQDNGASTAIAASNIGQNVQLLSGANNGFISGWGIDNANINNTATTQCKIMGLVRRNDNAFGQYAKFLVLINNHLYKGGTGTVGI
jgi:hypothetical protein